MAKKKNSSNKDSQNEIKEIKIIGEAYRELQEVVKKYAELNFPVLFSGETGTGKELFLQLYMASSKLRGKKMTVNCAAFSDDLLSSEVFGHVKGAYTGAENNRLGKIDACKDGIIALDEIGDASPQFQAAILRVSEGNSYSSVGSDEEKQPNTLIIAATNKIENLRDDLKERFNILQIPPLNKNDIPVLAQHFLGRPLTTDCIDYLKANEYKGNIRSLKRTCEKLKTESGNDIYSKKKVNTYNYNFDYERFRRELKTWNRYIKPVITHYSKDFGVPQYKYEYQMWDGDPLKWILNKKNFLHCKKIVFNINDPPGIIRNVHRRIEKEIEIDCFYSSHYFYHMLAHLKKIIGEERDFPSKDIPRLEHSNKYIGFFKTQIRNIFEYSMLPCFLGFLYLRAENSQEKPVTIEDPHLLYLLDLLLEQALTEFLEHYYQYNTKKYSDEEIFYEKTRVEKKVLRERIRRRLAASLNPQNKDNNNKP